MGQSQVGVCAYVGRGLWCSEECGRLCAVRSWGGSWGGTWQVGDARGYVVQKGAGVRPGVTVLEGVTFLCSPVTKICHRRPGVPPLPAEDSSSVREPCLLHSEAPIPQARAIQVLNEQTER